MKNKFFGWENIKWLIKEFVAMYSNKDSYFSKKRFESSIAFLSAVGIILWYVVAHKTIITNSEILADASLLFVIAGYTVKQIQTEKKDIPLNDISSKDNSDTSPKNDNGSTT